jgi:hypothetical protein
MANIKTIQVSANFFLRWIIIYTYYKNDFIVLLMMYRCLVERDNHFHRHHNHRINENNYVWMSYDTKHER